MIDGAPHCTQVREDQAACHDVTVDDLVVINRPVKLVLGPTRKKASAVELANQEKANRELEEFDAKIAIRQLAMSATVEHPPARATAPRCCTQRTVTIPGTVTPKLRQPLYWGSPEWIESYSRRTYVEGFFDNMKNPSTENVRRGWCRVVGMVKTSILAACEVAATNIRLLRSWAVGRDVTDPVVRARRARPRLRGADLSRVSGSGRPAPSIPGRSAAAGRRLNPGERCFPAPARTSTPPTMLAGRGKSGRRDRR